MVLVLLAYIGGLLTILSPCILPVLPFVFARSGQPFRRSGLPLLAGMVLTFSVVASLATAGGNWAVRTNQYGRAAALILFGALGLALIFPALSDRLTRPIVRLGGAISEGRRNGSALNSFVLGIGTGFLWAPCAGPILGLILTGAALQGVSASTAGLLLAYALGAATSLAVALLAGNRVFAALKRGLGAEQWVRRVLGAVILFAVAAVALGFDKGVLTQVSLSSGTSQLEQSVLNRLHPAAAATSEDRGSGSALTTLPPLDGATTWINSAPLTPAALKGHVVLIDFWTYSCINCLRTLPYVKSWYEKYKDSGLIVIGIHTPEFPFEKDEASVRGAVRDLGVAYPVAMDNDYRIWRAFHNQYWPAHYFIDATGVIRFHHDGEGDYAQSEQWIRMLLAEANHTALPPVAAEISGAGTQAAPDAADIQSYETYVGYEEAESFVSPGGLVNDKPAVYRAPAALDLNEWAFEGNWQDSAKSAAAMASGAAITYRFHSRDLHLVLGPSDNGNPVRFRVTIDGKEPGDDHGTDTDAHGNGVVTADKLYQLIRQKDSIRDRTFRIEFLDPGVRAYSFTFG
ncbi:MAG TPA: cytochrome c biogenesis protein DipZ [Bryobacteraceae bacterium]|jgi:cytochrome c biogenesis protein CcdA/thiol-disulfide isomerase/thioredoxin